MIQSKNLALRDIGYSVDSYVSANASLPTNLKNLTNSSTNGIYDNQEKALILNDTIQYQTLPNKNITDSNADKKLYYELCATFDKKSETTYAYKSSEYESNSLTDLYHDSGKNCYIIFSRIFSPAYNN
jgi:hypothetical protein